MHLTRLASRVAGRTRLGIPETPLLGTLTYCMPRRNQSSAANMAHLPLSKRIEWLVDLARTSSEEFSSPDAQLARRLYRAKHPTCVAVFNCMDGRVNLSLATRTPVGILQAYRNLGGRFDLGWPHLGDSVNDTVLNAVNQGRRVLAIVTYHYSKGDHHRGCAGFNYDTQAALNHTMVIQSQFDRIFGEARSTVFCVVAGFETDEDALILHGSNGRLLKLAELTDADRSGLRGRLDTLFPDMPTGMRDDLMPLLLGNMDHIKEMRRTERILEIEHKEWIIGVGRGFDWLHVPNTALLIGPFSPDLSTPIRTAASIISANMEAGRIRSDGFLLLASSPYEETGVDRARAEVKARFIKNFCQEVIQAANPELANRMEALACVVNTGTRRVKIVGEDEGYEESIVDS